MHPNNAQPDTKNGHRSRARALNLAFKTAIVLVFGAVLYYELASKAELPQVWASFLQQMRNANPLWLLGAALLFPFNWAAEAKKWQPYVHRYDATFDFARAYRAVFAGVAFSLFTPNRVGEFGGRILFVKPEHRWKAVIANFVGNLSQLLVLISVGIFGAWWILRRMTWISLEMSNWLLFALFLALPVMGYCYFNLQKILPIARRIKWLQKLKRYVKDVRSLEQFETRDLAQILAWAFIRYAIYSTQYFLLLRFFDIQIGLVDGFAGICTLFLIQTGIPLPPIAGLTARGSLAVFMWSQFGANEVSSLSTTFVLWIINLIFPALIGTFFISYVNIAKTSENEDA